MFGVCVYIYIYIYARPGKAILSAHVSRADRGADQVKEILPALPSTAVLQHATAQ